MIWYPYQQMKKMDPPYKIVDAQGVYLHTEDQTHIDSVSSWWCMIHGYKHPELTAAILLAERLAACPDTRRACRYPGLGQKRPLLNGQKMRRQPPGAFFRNRLLYIHADPPAACPQKAGDVCGGM